MKVIEEFWYGNLYPIERPFYRRRKIEKILKLLNQNEEKLLETLNEAENYEEKDIMYDISSDAGIINKHIGKIPEAEKTPNSVRQ